MTLSKKALRKKRGIPSISSCFLMMLVVALTTMGAAMAAGKPATLAERALYKGADRQKILEEGARKEGKLTFYTTGTQSKFIVTAFEKKYPYLKVEVWRGDVNQVLAKILEEYRAKKTESDVIGGTDAMEIVLREGGIVQPFYSPELVQIEEEAIMKAPGGGVYSAGHFESVRGVGFNTKLLKREEAPQTYPDLLNPKWKGKMVMTGDFGGVVWMGALLATYGEEFVKKVAQQDIAVHMVSARAINDMIIAGEYSLSPTISDAHAAKSKQEGAPIDWIALEPAAANLGQILLPKGCPHPHAAMLYIDFDLSKEAGEIYKAEGYNSPRKDVVNLRTYKKYYGFTSTEVVKKRSEIFSRLFLKK